MVGAGARGRRGMRGRERALRPPPPARRAPRRVPRAAAETRGPTCVAGSSGSPHASAAVAPASCSRNASKRPAATITRRLAVQRCPANANAPCATSAAARGRSAPSQTIAALFPPSSAWSGMRRRAQISCAVQPASEEPERDTASTPGSLIRAVALRWSPVTRSSRPSGKPRFLRERERQLREARRGRRRLPHDRVAERERRADLSPRDRDRIVPGCDDRDHALRHPPEPRLRAARLHPARRHRRRVAHERRGAAGLLPRPVSRACRRRPRSVGPSVRPRRRAGPPGATAGPGASPTSRARQRRPAKRAAATTPATVRRGNDGVRSGFFGIVAWKSEDSRPDPGAMTREQVLDRCKTRGAAVEVPARHRGVERIVAADRVLRDHDRKAALVGVEHGRAHAAVQVHAGDDQRVGARAREDRIELRRVEGGEERLRDDRLSGARARARAARVARRAAHALPAADRLPVRHAIVRRGVDRRHGVHDRHAARARARRAGGPPSRRPPPRRARARPRRGSRSADRRGAEAASSTLGGPAFERPRRCALPSRAVPTTVVPGSAMSNVRKPSRSTSSTAASIQPASRARPKLSRSIMASEAIWPSGFARPWPARSSADPWFVW